jgi:hypothetical protein
MRGHDDKELDLVEGLFYAGIIVALTVVALISSAR